MTGMAILLLVQPMAAVVGPESIPRAAAGAAGEDAVGDQDHGMLRYRGRRQARRHVTMRAVTPHPSALLILSRGRSTNDLAPRRALDLNTSGRPVRWVGRSARS